MPDTTHVNLQNIAQTMNEMMQNVDGSEVDKTTETAEPTTNSQASDVNTNTDEVPIIIGSVHTSDAESSVENNNTPGPAPIGIYSDLDDVSPVPIIVAGITEEDLRATVPDISDEKFRALIPDMKIKLTEYQKSLIKQGFTVEEAREATVNHMKREGMQINTAWLEENPEKVDVVIDKTQQDEIEFTEEEKDKLYRTKAIRLVVMENKTLETLPIAKVSSKYKVDYLETLKSGLSKYSVPMPATGDFFTFSGAQIIQLATVMQQEDETMDQILMRKAQLVYDKFIGGTILKKTGYGPKGKGKLSFDEFCNKVSFLDIDMALYGVLCAGQMEEAETSMECKKCKHSWTHRYNTKTLLSQDGFSDVYKERADYILGHSQSREILLEKQGEITEGARYKSPFSNNIYDISIPSIAKANRVFKNLKADDVVAVYTSATAMYVDHLYVWDEANDAYLDISSSDEEMDLLLKTMAMIPDEDSKLLVGEIRDKFMYTPQFKLKVVCPNCGNEKELSLSIDNLVFQKAQDFYTEMM